MKKKVLALTLTMAMVLGLAACASAPAPAPAAAPAAQAEAVAEKAEEAAEKAEEQAEAVAEAVADVAYPNGPIQVVISAKPGGDADSSGRLLCKDLEKYIGTTMVPVNIDGGGGNLAMQQIMDGAADGQQLINWFSFANAVVGGKLEYNWEDLVPVASFAKNDTQILVTRKGAPFTDAQSLVAYMKEHPGEVSIAVTKGSPSHYHAVAFEQAGGVQFKKVDIGSGADKVVALLSGEVDIISSTTGIMKDYLASGEAVAIGSIAAERSAFAPDIPTMNEQGVDIGDVGFGVHYVFWAKAGTDQAIIDKLVDAVKQMEEDEQFKTDCENLQFSPEFLYGDDLAEFEQAYFDFLNGMSDVIVSDEF